MVPIFNYSHCEMVHDSIFPCEHRRILLALSRGRIFVLQRLMRNNSWLENERFVCTLASCAWTSFANSNFARVRGRVVKPSLDRPIDKYLRRWAVVNNVATSELDNWGGCSPSRNSRVALRRTSVVEMASGINALQVPHVSLWRFVMFTSRLRRRRNNEKASWNRIFMRDTHKSHHSITVSIIFLNDYLKLTTWHFIPFVVKNKWITI